MTTVFAINLKEFQKWSWNKKHLERKISSPYFSSQI